MTGQVHADRVHVRDRLLFFNNILERALFLGEHSVKARPSSANPVE